jgi:hypothetical protein
VIDFSLAGGPQPQTFVDIYSAKEGEFRKATQRVYRSKDMASHITLPVLR